MKVKVTRVGVTCESSIMDVGAIVEVPDKDAERLIAAGYVEAVEVQKALKAEEAPEQPAETPKKATRGKK